MADDGIKLVSPQKMTEDPHHPVQVTSKPVRKREYDDSEVPIKRQKSDEDNDLKSDTKITDVIDDCLEPIFDLLKFKDLSCVAIAHEHFKQAAGLVFGRKYGKKEIRMTSDGITVLEDDDYVRSVYHGFSVKKSSYYIDFLQNLGSRMSKLNIGLNNVMYKPLEPVLLKNCQESLVELSLYKPAIGLSKLHDVFGSIKTPFPNVVKLCLNRCHLNERASLLNVWFPQLQRLTLFDCTFANPKLIVTKYPSLEHLSIGGWKDENALKKSQVCAILRLNSQIRSLDIGLAADGHEFKLYQRINQIQPQLESLNLCWEQFSFKNHDDEDGDNNNKIITFKHLKSLVLDFSFHSFSGARVLPFEFDQLTELEINNIPHLTSEWMHFIVQNKGLTKLSVLPFNEFDLNFGRPNNQDLLRFGKELHNLTTLTIDATEISTGCLLLFMQMCQLLTELRLHWNDGYAFNSFQRDFFLNGTNIFAQIQDEWHIPLNTNSPIILKRKTD